jgi:hypothetical protein
MEGWSNWAKHPPDGHDFVEWVRLDHRDGVSAVQTNRVADLHAAWDGKQWNLAAIYWRPARSNVIALHR